VFLYHVEECFHRPLSAWGVAPWVLLNQCVHTDHLRSAANLEIFHNPVKPAILPKYAYNQEQGQSLLLVIKLQLYLGNIVLQVLCSFERYQHLSWSRAIRLMAFKIWILPCLWGIGRERLPPTHWPCVPYVDFTNLFKSYYFNDIEAILKNIWFKFIPLVEIYQVSMEQQSAGRIMAKVLLYLVLLLILYSFHLHWRLVGLTIADWLFIVWPHSNIFFH